MTELGEELLPLCRELERFGRLYEAAKDLVPELMGGNDIPWAESDGTAAGSTDAGSPQNTEDDFNNLPAKKVSAKDRHGFYQADNAFVFFNPHCEFEDWYFYGETAGEMTELYLITDPEYQLFMAALKNTGSKKSGDVKAPLFTKNSRFKLGRGDCLSVGGGHADRDCSSDGVKGKGRQFMLWKRRRFHAELTCYVKLSRRMLRELERC